MAIRGHEVDVIARLPGGNGAPLPARDPSTGVPILPIRVVRAPYRGAGARPFRHFLHRFPAGAFRLLRGVRALAPDLIAAHCPKLRAPYVATPRAALGVPVPAHLHTGPQSADRP